MPHTRVAKHVWSRMLTSCTTSVTFVSRLLKDGRRRGFTSTFCGVQRSVLECREVTGLSRTFPEHTHQLSVALTFDLPMQVVGGMLGANKVLEGKLEEVLNTRGVSLYGVSEVMDFS